MQRKMTSLDSKRGDTHNRQTLTSSRSSAITTRHHDDETVADKKIEMWSRSASSPRTSPRYTVGAMRELCGGGALLSQEEGRNGGATVIGRNARAVRAGAGEGRETEWRAQ
jgi:hypothetical protein